MNIRTGLIWSAFLFFLGIALIAPAANTYGQLVAQENLLSQRNNELVSYRIDFQSESNKMENWMNLPFLSTTYLEEELHLESWMVTPFESTNIDEDLTVESWMMVPFETDQETEVEDWMASVWF